MLGNGGHTCHKASTSLGTINDDQTKGPTGKSSVAGQLRAGVFILAAVAVAACSSAPQQKSKFSPKKYGVKGSPKVVASGKPVPKGGGRAIVGKKYKIAGKWYYPKYEPNYKKTGLASWYGPTFHGRKTANGEIFDRNALTAAHTTMPLPSYARVTNLQNGRSMIVRVNDRGPFHGNRVIDLSERVANMLDTKSKGVGKVKVEYVGKAPLHGRDETYLMASYRGPGSVEPGTSRPGTMLALVQPKLQPQLVLTGAPPPAPRPYISAPLVTAFNRPAPNSVSVAFDPAITFESGQANIRLASNNRFEPSAEAYVPTPGTLGVLTTPNPGIPAFASGSAVSSYMANQRVSDAHALLASISESGIPLRKLASRTQ